jgi:CubicO group peptidase (beta-lactamase class C family)
MMRLTLIAFVAFPGIAAAQGTLTDLQRHRIDSAANAVLESTGAPGAAIAIVQGGRIVYEHAYGRGRIEPDVPASPSMRYAVGSVSKQFTATAVLLLAEEGKLSLDDKVAKWFPNLTRANDITLRQLLSMTSGYQDYWPHDYVFTDMLRPTSPSAILDRWARKPLDFTPGTKWQYSNTNFVIAGQIVERITGMPIVDFLRRRIFTPLGMTSVVDFDAGPLPPTDAGAYLRYGLGPLRPAPKEGKGWLGGAGELAMTAHDLALWDISVIDQKILKPASYRLLESDVPLSNGVATGYGLGVSVTAPDGRRRIAHNGAVSGYLTSDQIFPDDRTAVVVFANVYPGAAAPDAQIGDAITGILFDVDDRDAAAARSQAKQIFAALEKGTIDRSLFSANANAFFTAQVLQDFSTSLGPLGEPSRFELTGKALRGGMTLWYFDVELGSRAVEVSMFVLPDGKIEQYLVQPR